MLKNVVSFLTAVIVIICCSFTCLAVDFDGVPHNDEWFEGAIYSFENPDGFNNDVSFAYMRLIPHPESNQLYLCISMRVDDISSPQSSGVILSLNSGEEIRLDGSGNSPYNTDLYNIEYAMAYDEGSSNIVYEIMLGVKYGIPNGSYLCVRVCDCRSIPSNEFGFDLDIVNDVVQSEEAESSEKSTTKKSSADKSNKTNKNNGNKGYSKTNKKSSSNKNKDSFTFKKVETDVTQSDLPQSNAQGTTSTVNLSEQTVENSSVKGKVLTAVGALGALAVVTCAVYSGIKKSNKKTDDK